MRRLSGQISGDRPDNESRGGLETASNLFDNPEKRSSFKRERINSAFKKYDGGTSSAPKLPTKPLEGGEAKPPSATATFDQRGSGEQMEQPPAEDSVTKSEPETPVKKEEKREP